MGKCCLIASSLIFDRIIIKVAGNQHRHTSLHKFDFEPDQTTQFGVTCPWMAKILHFRTWISLRPVGTSWSNFMCSITGGGERLHTVSRQIGWKLWGPWLIMGKMVSPPLAGNKDTHKISTEFEFWPDQTTDYGVSCPCASKKFPIDLFHASSFTFDRIIIKVAGKQDMFLIRSFLYLQVMRTCIKSQTSLNFGQIGPLTTELAALERLKNFPWTYNGKMVSPC